MSNRIRFAFVKVFVDNIEKQAAFYRAAFGMVEKNRLTVERASMPSRRSSSPADAAMIHP